MGRVFKIVRPADFESVRACVAEIEKKTRAQVVPLVVAQAGVYWGLSYVLIALAGLLPYLLAEVWANARHWPLGWEEKLGVAVLGIVGVGVALQWGALQRLILGRDTLARAVHQRAMAEFVEHGCSETQDRVGVLVLLALFEKRIEIIADRGVQEKAVQAGGNEVWKRFTHQFVEQARQGHPVEGYLETLQSLGAFLSEILPGNSSVENHLSNELRTEG